MYGVSYMFSFLFSICFSFSFSSTGLWKNHVFIHLHNSFYTDELFDMCRFLSGLPNVFHIFKIMLFHYCILYMFWTTPGSIQRLLLDLCSEIIHGWAQKTKPFGMSYIKTKLAPARRMPSPLYYISSPSSTQFLTSILLYKMLNLGYLIPPFSLQSDYFFCSRSFIYIYIYVYSVCS